MGSSNGKHLFVAIVGGQMEWVELWAKIAVYKEIAGFAVSVVLLLILIVSKISKPS